MGLKIKQDLLHRRQEEKEKSEERDLVGAVGLLGPPPPLPPGIPGKSNGTNGIYKLQAEQPLDDFTSSILRHAHPSFPTSSLLGQKESPRRPSSVLGGGSSSLSSASRHTQDLDQENSGGSSNGLAESTNKEVNNSNSSVESMAAKHRRVKSISEVDHIPVHTPV